MGKDTTHRKNVKATTYKVQKRAFTFIEVIIALAIASISLLAFFRLHIISINIIEKSRITSQAVFLANEKIAETLASGYPKEGTNSGSVKKNGLTTDWYVKVKALRLSPLDEKNIIRLRKISVDVNWKQGVGRKCLQMSTYVADRKIP